MINSLFKDNHFVLFLFPYRIKYLSTWFVYLKEIYYNIIYPKLNKRDNIKWFPKIISLMFDKTNNTHLSQKWYEDSLQNLTITYSRYLWYFIFPLFFKSNLFLKKILFLLLHCKCDKTYIVNPTPSQLIPMIGKILTQHIKPNTLEFLRVHNSLKIITKLKYETHHIYWLPTANTRKSKFLIYTSRTYVIKIKVIDIKHAVSSQFKSTSLSLILNDLVIYVSSDIKYVDL